MRENSAPLANFDLMTPQTKQIIASPPRRDTNAKSQSNPTLSYSENKNGMDGRTTQIHSASSLFVGIDVFFCTTCCYLVEEKPHLPVIYWHKISWGHVKVLDDSSLMFARAPCLAHMTWATSYQGVDVVDSIQLTNWILWNGQFYYPDVIKYDHYPSQRRG